MFVLQMEKIYFTKYFTTVFIIVIKYFFYNVFIKKMWITFLSLLFLLDDILFIARIQFHCYKDCAIMKEGVYCVYWFYYRAEVFKILYGKFY